MKRGRSLLLAIAWALAFPSAAQLLHEGADAKGRLVETVDLVDAWSDAPSDLVFSSTAPRDVLVRIRAISPAGEKSTVHLLLFGPWGAFHYSFAESDETTDGVVARGVRTSWLPLDVDADGRNEIVIVERTVGTRVPLEETGEPQEGAEPLFSDFAVALRVLDREGERLIEQDLAADPDSAAFRLLAQQEIGGAAGAALQQAAGDFLFAAEKHELARYRYVVVREWAEGQVKGHWGSKLSVDASLARPDPDDPVFAWIAATRRAEALPSRFRPR